MDTILRINLELWLSLIYALVLIDLPSGSGLVLGSHGSGLMLLVETLAGQNRVSGAPYSW